MPRYSFTLDAEIEADGLRDAEEKIKAGVGFEEVDIIDGPNEMEVPVEDDDEETTTP